VSAERGSPAFLGIGAQKAATTWLDRCLRRHPSLWLPPIKELHYFDDPGAGRPVLGRGWAGRRLRRELVPRLRADARFLDRGGLRWAARYFFGRRDDGWYLSLFPGDLAAVCGEITPDYSILDAAAVDRVHRLLPEVKLIFLMRDPIDRSWSQIRMDVARSGRRAATVPPDELIGLARSARIARRSDYGRTLRSWGSHYADERFFIGFLEDIRARPEEVLADLFGFLGVDPTVDVGPALARRRVHSGPGEDPIPPALEVELARLHVDGLRALAERFGGHARGWLDRAERLLGG
jgi:hypothetical protein